MKKNTLNVKDFVIKVVKCKQFGSILTSKPNTRSLSQKVFQEKSISISQGHNGP
jgi:hypothetical protein